MIDLQFAVDKGGARLQNTKYLKDIQAPHEMCGHLIKNGLATKTTGTKHHPQQARPQTLS